MRPALYSIPAVGSGHASLAGILRERLLQPRFQPVIDLAQSRIYGQSLIRGPSDSALHFPDALFAEARRQGLHPQLELASFAPAPMASMKHVPRASCS